MPSFEQIDAYLAKISSDPNTVLGLSVGKHTSITPGTFVPKADAQDPPTLSLPSSLQSSDKTYLVVCLDLDAPFQSFRVLSPIHHWTQAALKSDAASSTLTTSAPHVVDWAAPAPPPGSGPHRYCFFLYEQPETFAVPTKAPKVGMSARIRFNLESYEAEHGLQGKFVGGSYYTSN